MGPAHCWSRFPTLPLRGVLHLPDAEFLPAGRTPPAPLFPVSLPLAFAVLWFESRHPHRGVASIRVPSAFPKTRSKEATTDNDEHGSRALDIGEGTASC